jgi:DNA invertase Pin-like site-specific DNA recombinase
VSALQIRPATLPTLNSALSAILAEQKRRGKKRPDSDKISRQGQLKVVSVPLTQGKLNAVRAAFKAGVTPSRIARQFGISLADVRKALASVSGKQ